ncbi:BTAD domain-containing putative transcriptional regulator [Nonomuraea sp. NPDC050783]|uniref:AfsR/SARP family transcriptional regulator n=1 Tax=Nonomuraea sp. NPDC050783 TaxID=3154634 RepID=UPI0034653E19
MFPDIVQSLVRRHTRVEQPILHLFSGPYVSLGTRRIDVPEGSKRLLVFVALRHGPVERRHAAGALWPVGDDSRAAGNLRSALWRLGKAGVNLLAVDQHSLALHPDVLVDLDLVTAWAGRVIGGRAHADDLSMPLRDVSDLDLLPGWYDDWALMERERIRQRLLHALEAQCRGLTRAGRHGDAVDVAMVAVLADPLRESAQRVLMEAHLSEGNWNEARHSFERYARTLSRELGAWPSSELAALLRRPVRGLGDERAMPVAG